MVFIVTRWEREADIKGTILNINIKPFPGQKGPRQGVLGSCIGLIRGSRKV